MRAASGKGEAAENGNVDVGVEAADVVPIGQVESVGFEGVAQFQQGVGAAHLLQGEHIGFEGENAFADFGFGGGELGGAGLGGLIEITFQVVGGDTEGLGGGEAGAAQQGEEEGRRVAETRARIHGRGNKPRDGASQRGFRGGRGRESFCKMIVGC